MEQASTRTPSLNHLPYYVAAALSFAAELMHLWALPDEYIWWPLRGFFILMVAMFQGWLAISLLFRPSPRVLFWGIWVNIAVIFIWAFTRILGIPIFITFHQVPVGEADLAATVIEWALVILLWRLRRDLRKQAAQPNSPTP